MGHTRGHHHRHPLRPAGARVVVKRLTCGFGLTHPRHTAPSPPWLQFGQREILEPPRSAAHTGHCTASCRSDRMRGFSGGAASGQILRRKRSGRTGRRWSRGPVPPDPARCPRTVCAPSETGLGTKTVAQQRKPEVGTTKHKVCLAFIRIYRKQSLHFRICHYGRVNQFPPAPAFRAVPSARITRTSCAPCSPFLNGRPMIVMEISRLDRRPLPAGSHHCLNGGGFKGPICNCPVVVRHRDGDADMRVDKVKLLYRCLKGDFFIPVEHHRGVVGERGSSCKDASRKRNPRISHRRNCIQRFRVNPGTGLARVQWLINYAERISK